LKGSKPIWMLMFENKKLIFLDFKMDVRERHAISML
jgi:hypothetical protein